MRSDLGEQATEGAFDFETRLQMFRMTSALVLGMALAAQSPDRAEITADGRIFPESLTHAKDGTL